MKEKENANALFKVCQGLLLEEDLDFSTSGNVDSLNRILTVSRDRSGFVSECPRWAGAEGTHPT